MSQLKQLLEKATQKNEMKWRVYAYDPAKDNKLVHTSELFDDINGAGIEKAEWLKKHPEHIIEIIAESAQKNERVTSYDPNDKSYYDKNPNLAIVKKLVKEIEKERKKDAYIRNAYDPEGQLSFAYERETGKYLTTQLAKKLYKQYSNESAQKNEDRLADLGYKVGDTFIIKDLPSYLKGKTAKILSSPYHNAPIAGEYVVDCIELTTGKKFRMPLDRLPKHTNESANIDAKNPGILEVPDGKKVNELPQSHFEKLVDKNGYQEVVRALTNLEVWNKDKNKSLSSWASNMADKLKKKFRPESAQKNEATFKPGDKVSVKSYYKDGNQFITLRDATIIKEITEKEAGQLDPAYNWKEPTGMKYYLVKLNTGSKKAVLASDLTLESVQKNEADPNAEKTLITKKQTIQRLAAKLTNDNLLPQLKQFKDYVDDVYNFALKNFDESAQMNETRSYKVTVMLEVPDKMNNRDIEDYIENRVDNSNFGVYVLDVTAERK